MLFCVFKQKTAYEMRISDWSSDVCSSDLAAIADVQQVRPLAAEGVVDRGAVRDQALAALLRALQAHQPGDVGAVAVELERDPRVIAAGPAVVVRAHVLHVDDPGAVGRLIDPRPEIGRAPAIGDATGGKLERSEKRRVGNTSGRSSE